MARASVFGVRVCSDARPFAQAGLDGDARGSVDADVDELPARAPCRSIAGAASVALFGAVAGDAVTNAVAAPELLDVDMDPFAGVLTLVAAHGLGRIEIALPRQAYLA